MRIIRHFQFPESAPPPVQRWSETMADQEARLRKLNHECSLASGMPSFPRLDEQRRELLREIAKARLLTRWEYICCWGCGEWRRFCKENGLPENYPTAEEQPMVVTGELEVVVETWDDPGDYPSNAGAGPLPSHQYAVEVAGEIQIVVSGEVDVKTGTYDSLEEANYRIFELLEEKLPIGISVSQWEVEVDGKTLKFRVADFEGPDW